MSRDPSALDSEGSPRTVFRDGLSREGILRVIRDEFSEAVRASDILTDDRQRIAVRVGLVVLYQAIMHEVTAR
jgi:hypothetical protein